ncbi:FxLYD domain-containing protein [Paenibacillus sp. GYB004]|uniref:FxLYD domain-containing protein n=1 Tax=Paenibacillus sp. GYB004 TaxID=2994393 RepID=UPI002F96D075
MWDVRNEKILIDPVNSQQSQSSEAPQGSYKVGDIVFSDVSAKHVLNNHWNIAVNVKNTSAKNYSYISFTISFFDGNGKRVGTAQDTVHDLNANESKTATFSSIDDISSYKTMKFQINVIK